MDGCSLYKKPHALESNGARYVNNTIPREKYYVVYILAHKKGTEKMYKIDYSYLEDCDGGYSKAIDKIETVAHYLNNTHRLTCDAVMLNIVLTILGIKEEKDGK